MSARIHTTCGNGPMYAGVGALADPGLNRNDYHRICPQSAGWATVKFGWADIESGCKRTVGDQIIGNQASDEHLLRIIAHNAHLVAPLEELRAQIGDDMATRIGAVVNVTTCLIAGLGLYDDMGEYVRVERDAWEAIAIGNADALAATFTSETINAALTLIFAKAQSKWTTNHAIGGQGGSGSFLAATRALFDIPEGHMRAVMGVLYKVVHPISDRAMFPKVADNVEELAQVGPNTHFALPAIVIESFLSVRKTALPAGCHYLAVGAAALPTVIGMGLLPFVAMLDSVPRLVLDIANIRRTPASYHASANFLGLQRQTIDQKQYTSLISDLAYALTKLHPGHSLTGSPIFTAVMATEVNAPFRALVDAVRAAVRERTAEALRAAVDHVVNKIRPTAGTAANIDVAVFEGAGLSQLGMLYRQALMGGAEAAAIEPVPNPGPLDPDLGGEEAGDDFADAG